jgi:hypothetical protein
MPIPLQNLPGRGQAVARTIYGAKGTPGGNIPIYNVPGALTRDQRAGNLMGATKASNRQEQIASLATGRGSIKQKDPAKKSAAPVGQDQFVDAAGNTRQKMSVGNWRSQQQGQMGQYRGFSSAGLESVFVHGMPIVSF